MKRPRSPTEPPEDPVLAQLDALINGPSPVPWLAPQPPDLPPVDPVLAQLDALISGGEGSSSAVAVSAPPRLCVPLPPAPPPVPQEEPYTRPTGPPGLLRDFGGVHGYMRQLKIQEPEAHDAQAGARLGPEPVAPRDP